MLNTTARDYRIWVCKPGQDESTGLEVTAQCSGDTSGFFSVTVNPQDESGLMKVSGTLNLQVTAGVTTFDPWENPTQWAVGNHVIVKVADVAGTLRQLPVSKLYLLSTPIPPTPASPLLTLELGDRFQLLSAKLPETPPANYSGLATGVNTANPGFTGSRTAAINRLLVGTGLTLSSGLAGTVSDYKPNMDSPLISQVGELAIGGYANLYLNKTDTIKPVWIGYTQAYRLFLHTVGVDDAADFELLDSPLRPATEVEVVSTDSVADTDPEDLNDDSNSTDPRKSDNYDSDENSDAQKYSGSNHSVEYLSESAIYDGGGSTEVRAIIRDEVWNWSETTYKRTTTETRCRGLVIPEDLYEKAEELGLNISSTTPLTLVTGIVEVEEKTYESGPEGRLLKTVVTSARQKGEVLAEWYRKNMNATTNLNFLTMIDAERTVTTYSHTTANGKDSPGQVRQIKTEKYLPIGQVAAGASDWAKLTAISPIGLILCDVSIESWSKRDADTWEHKLNQYQAGRVRAGTVSGFTRLAKVRGITEVSRNGDIQPPSAERRPALEGENRKRNPTFRGSGTFQTSNSNADRKRVIAIGNLKGYPAAKKLAELLGEGDQLRQYGFRVTTVLRDEWFSFWPMCRLDIDYNGYIYQGCIDGLTITLSASQAVVVADCLKAGRYPA